ncbi:hypothetical protein AAFO92_22325 [Roseovarius sp. CAU 1744]|uniref:hypothetical protein n=1 Tax=Roseovarius sp. CAU 1744 TaxID=3140368 RepID=UPI00325AE207
MRLNFMVTSVCLASLSLSAIACSSTPALAESACVAVYRNAVADVSESQTLATERSYLFNLYCSASGETREWTSSAALSFPIKGIPVGIKGDGNFSSNDLKEFCKLGKEQNYAFGAEYNFDRVVALDALSNFNQCIELENKTGLTITHESAPPRSVIFTGKFADGHSQGTLDTVEYDQDRVECTSASFSEDQTSRKIHGSVQIPIGTHNFTITCVRKAKDDGEDTYYPMAPVQIGTSFGPYTVLMPPDKLFGFQTASQAKVAHAEVVEKLHAANSDIGAKAQRIQQLRNRWGNRAMRIVYTGDNPAAFNAHSKNPCGTDVDNDHFMNGVCQRQRGGLVLDGWKHVATVTGGVCSHTFHVVHCIGDY